MEEQKQYWLPLIAQGQPLCGIAITDPDYGSDVASIRLKATSIDDGWLFNGAEAWSTFVGISGVLLTLARTDPGLSLGHRGLTPFVVEKPEFEGEEFEVTQESGRILTGKAIPTVGYRGMHSFNLFFDDFLVRPGMYLARGRESAKAYTMLCAALWVGEFKLLPVHVESCRQLLKLP